MIFELVINIVITPLSEIFGRSHANNSFTLDCHCGSKRQRWIHCDDFLRSENLEPCLAHISTSSHYRSQLVFMSASVRANKTLRA